MPSPENLVYIQKEKLERIRDSKQKQASRLEKLSIVK